MKQKGYDLKQSQNNEINIVDLQRNMKKRKKENIAKQNRGIIGIILRRKK